MTQLLFLVIGLYLGYRLCQAEPTEGDVRLPLLTRMVETLIRHLAQRTTPNKEEMIRLTKEAVSCGCALHDLLDHYTKTDPANQAMRPRQVYTFGTINVRYLYDYLPQRNQKLPDERHIADLLYDFKAGDYTRALFDEFVQLLREQQLDKTRYLLICMPASTQRKTQLRYENFSDHLCREMGWEDGYGIIMPIDHESQHTTGDRMIRDERHYKIQYDKLRGKNVILLDDVLTTGNTLLSLSGIIERAGGHPVEAIFLCRTLQTH